VVAALDDDAAISDAFERHSGAAVEQVLFALGLAELLFVMKWADDEGTAKYKQIGQMFRKLELAVNCLSATATKF
jgi:hypothetical protein